MATTAQTSNKAAFQRLVEAGFGQGDEAAVDELVAVDTIEHQFGLGPGAEGVKQATRFLHRLAPDFNLIVQEMVEDGDKVWGRMRATGTHTGPGLGEPTGKPFDITVFDIARFEDGKIVEHWGVPDRFAQMAQLGLLPGGRPQG